MPGESLLFSALFMQGHLVAMGGIIDPCMANVGVAVALPPLGQVRQYNCRTNTDLIDL